MGYYTYHDLTMTDFAAATPDNPIGPELSEEDPRYAEILELFRTHENISENGPFELPGLDWEQDSCKWYSRTEDMAAISKAVPTVLFKIHCEGEEPGDLWDEYYLNGKAQECFAEIVYPPFDPSKLVEV